MSAWEVIAECQRRGETCVVVTVLGARGSVPGQPGAKAVVTAAGLIHGTLGGGRVEARAMAEAGMLLAGGDDCVERCWNLQQDVGMTCGGEMRFLFEVVRSLPAWHVVIFGAGHVAQALSRLLATLCCRVDVVDPRAEWIGKLATSARVRGHLTRGYEDGLAMVEEGSFVVCVTQGHRTDRPVLRELLGRATPLPFVGVIGSAAKRAVLRRELLEDGVDPERVEAMVCPVGLPIGGNDPAEIAISIAAQLLQRRDPR
jgi:xanthine dehydrogenase accessory factor